MCLLSDFGLADALFYPLARGCRRRRIIPDWRPRRRQFLLLLWGGGRRCDVRSRAAPAVSYRAVVTEGRAIDPR